LQQKNFQKNANNKTGVHGVYENSITMIQSFLPLKIATKRIARRVK